MTLSTKRKTILCVILITGLCLRLFFLYRLPFTNDEGAYLYDAKMLLQGRLSGGDVLVKSPAAIFSFTFFDWVTRGSIYSARVAAMFWGLLSVIPLAMLVYFWRKRFEYFVAAVWLLFSAPVLLLCFGQTEASACFFGVLSLGLLVWAFNKKEFVWIALFGGAAFALALASRKTGLALIFPIGLLFFQNRADRKLFRKVLMFFACGFGVVILFFSFFVFGIYGWDGFREFLGFGYAHIAQARLAGDGSVDIWGYNFFDAFQTIARIGTAHVVLAGVGLIGVLVVALKKKWRFVDSLLAVPFVWLIGLIVIYAAWPTFLPDYAADFLVPTTLLGVLVVSSFWKQCGNISKTIIVCCFAVLNLVSYFVVAKTSWTGMFNAPSVKEMALVMQEMVPRDEPVLTAAVIVPYLSVHHTYLDISHPLWYRYDFISEKEKNIFLPAWQTVASDIQQRKVKWLLMEHLTDYAYFRNSDQLINGLDKNWELVATVPNNTGFRSNTLKLYRRK